MPTMIREMVCTECARRQPYTSGAVCSNCGADALIDATPAMEMVIPPEAIGPRIVGRVTLEKMPAVSVPPPPFIKPLALPPQATDSLELPPEQPLELATSPSGVGPSLDLPPEPVEPIRASSPVAPAHGVTSSPSGIGSRVDLPPEPELLPGLSDPSAEPAAEPAAPAFPTSSMPSEALPLPGIAAIVVGAALLVASLANPPEGTSRWGAWLAAAALVALGATIVAGVGRLRLGVVVIGALWAVAGVLRGDPLTALCAGAASAGFWFLTSSTDDDAPHRNAFAWAMLTPAVLLSLHGVATSLTDFGAGATVIASMRRQVDRHAVNEVESPTGFSLSLPGWHQSLEHSTEWRQPAAQTAVFVVTEELADSLPRDSDALTGVAAPEFVRHGWSSPVFQHQDDLFDATDESFVRMFRAGSGFSRVTGYVRVSRVDRHVCVATAYSPERRFSAVQFDLLEVAKSLRCRPAGQRATELTPAAAEALRRSFVTVHNGGDVRLGVAVANRAGKTLILTGDDGTGKSLLSVRPLATPSEPLTAALALRRASGAELLVADTDATMVPIPPVGSAPRDGGTMLVGLPANPSTGRMKVRPVGPAEGLQALVDAEGRLVALQAATVRLADQATLVELSKPRIRETAWRVSFDAQLRCLVDVRVELDDPFHDFNAVQLGWNDGKQETRLADEAVSTDVATVHVKVPCAPSAMMTVTAVGAESSVMKVSVKAPPIIPGVRLGRLFDESSVSSSTGEGLSFVYERREAPDEWAPVCTADVVACEKKCLGGDAEACWRSGLAKLANTQNALAANDFERACTAGSLVACVQLGFVATSTTTIDYRAVLSPWCDAGVEQMCNAARGESYAAQLKDAFTQCKAGGATSEACTSHALQVLGGARRGVDAVAAQGVLQRACNRGDSRACTALGRDLLRDGPSALARTAFETACKAADASACRELAAFYATGEGVPRSFEVAAKYLRDSCRASRDPEACGLLPEAAR